MPRISPKTQLLFQLRDIWLANSILTILFSEDDFELLKQILFASGGHRGRGGGVGDWEGGSGAEGYRRRGIEGSAGGLGWPVLDLDEDTLIEDQGSVGSDWTTSKDVMDAEVLEMVELLLLGIPRIRYLAPREPIPRSEYLFNSHVGNFKKKKKRGIIKLTCNRSIPCQMTDSYPFFE